MIKLRRTIVVGSRALLAGLALGALGTACGGAPDGQDSEPVRSSTTDLKVHPMDLGPFDILNDMKEIYADYQWLQQVDSAAPPPDQQILSELAQLQTQMTTLSGQLSSSRRRSPAPCWSTSRDTC